MATLFDLTVADAQIAAGRTIVEAAEALGVQATTVKTQLAHIFAKTDTRRQAELVELSAALALPLRA